MPHEPEEQDEAEEEREAVRRQTSPLWSAGEVLRVSG